MLYIFVLFIYCVHGTVVNPITPLQDRREYLFVNLQNNLQALLIQDPSTEKVIQHIYYPLMTRQHYH